MDNPLLVIAQEIRHEATTYVVSPVIRKNMINWAQRLEDIANRERKS